MEISKISQRVCQSYFIPKTSLKGLLLTLDHPPCTIVTFSHMRYKLFELGLTNYTEHKDVSFEAKVCIK